MLFLLCRMMSSILIAGSMVRWFRKSENGELLILSFLDFEYFEIENVVTILDSL